MAVVTSSPMIQCFNKKYVKLSKGKIREKIKSEKEKNAE